MNRRQLISKLLLVQPALAADDTVPIFAQLCFDGSQVHAYNGFIAVQTECETNFKGGVEGKLFISLLNKSQGSKIQIKEKDEKLFINAGTSDIKLPIIPEKDFVFEMPEEGEQVLEITNDFMNALKVCMISMNKEDQTQPQQMGITLSIDDFITLYSTDGKTIAEFVIGENVEYEKRELILPAEFCDTVCNVYKFIENPGVLRITNEYAIANFDECIIFGRLIENVDCEPFRSVISSTLDDLEYEKTPLPDKFDIALDQIITLLKRANQDECVLKMDHTELIAYANTDFGKIHRTLDLEKEHPDAEVQVDPRLISRVLKHTVYFAVTERCVILGSENYLYLIAV